VLGFVLAIIFVHALWFWKKFPNPLIVGDLNFHDTHEKDSWLPSILAPSEHRFHL
jgi:hypothetical protein